MTGRKIAIVGFARPHRDLAPYADESWEIWGVNDAWSFMPRADRWFEVHSQYIHEWEVRRAAGHMDFLANFAGPVVMVEHYDHIPNSVAFPLEEAIKDLGRVYFTSSIAYMLAMAIMERPDEIGIWGVDMASQTEYQQQRPCCEWMIGLAEGRGIKVTLPEGCKLMQGRVYGRGDLNPGGEKITQNQLHARLIELTEREQFWVGQVGEKKRKADEMLGALMETRHQLQQFATQPEVVTVMRARADQLEQKFNAAAQAVEEASESLMLTRGAKQDAQYWIGTTPEGADPRLLGGAATLAEPMPSTGENVRDALHALADLSGVS